MRAHEPHVRGIAALWVPSTGICDYRAVAEKLGELVVKEGGEIHLGRSVTALARRSADVVVRGDGPELLGTRVVACAGLHCDELARAAGADPGVRIVPFRGEYAGFSDRAASLVRGLIYPVPDPAFPFLGVHATRGIDGHVHAGPNAVLALAREGYGWGTVNPRELLSTLAYPGMLRVAQKHWRYGFGEMHRSLSKAAMARQIQRMLPDVTAADLSPAGAGCARRPSSRDGTLVDDFLFVEQGRGRGLGPARPQRALARRHRRPAHRTRDPGAAGPVTFTDVPAGFRSGFACFVGRPNAGKSTLTNALIGSKIAITSSRPQTTRHAIRGILHRPDAQLVVIDTPGLHKPRTLLGSRLNDVVRETWSEVDVIGFCVPADVPVGRGDAFIVNELKVGGGPHAGARRRHEDRPRAARAGGAAPRAARRAHGVRRDRAVLGGRRVPGATLADLLVARLPEGPPLYPDGELTDEPEETLVAELIREAALEGVRDELPHSIAVTIDEMVPHEGRDDLLDVHAVIHVERSSQKGIVIGKGGERLRQVGTDARRQIEALLGTKVFLDLHVKITKDWQRDPRQLRKLGF